MVKFGKNMSLIIMVLVLLIILDGGYSLFRIMSTAPSYVSGYEGAKARFAGVQYAGEDYRGDAWGTLFNWDPDSRGVGLPPIAGEMTGVFVPQESLGEQPLKLGGIDISGWLVQSMKVRNPVREPYEWSFPVEGSNETVFYRMEEWQLSWYFSISSEPSGDEIPTVSSIPDPTRLVRRNSLQDVKVWFELDISPIWYFEGADTAYFAIAKAQVSDVALGGKVGTEVSTDKVNDKLRTTPMSASRLTLYYGLFGSEANKADKEPYYYKDKKLNPDLFTDKVYTYITLEDFGVTGWWDFGNHYRADVVTMAVDVTLFVVGEWKVKDIEELPEDYGREAKTGGVNVLSPIGQFLASPEGRLLLLILAGLFVFLFLASFAPWVLFALIGAFKSDRRR